MSLLRMVSGIFMIAFFAGEVLAQNYPVKPIRIIVGFPAGGPTDIGARMVGQKLSEYLGQPVIVENRTGAAGTIADERVATSPPDGYTLLAIAASAAVQAALQRGKLTYDLERDLAPVSLVSIGAFMIVVHPSVPARNIRELITLARSMPGKLNFGSSGAGGATHLAGELFNMMANVRFVHVPFRGGTESTVAAASGQIELSFAAFSGLQPLIDAGKLRLLAVTTAKRSSLMPLIPTVSEVALDGYDYFGFNGVLAPAGVPRDIIARLNAMIAKAAGAPDLKEIINRQGFEPRTNTPEQFSALIRGEIAKNANLIKLAGLKAD